MTTNFKFFFVLFSNLNHRFFDGRMSAESQSDSEHRESHQSELQAHGEIFDSDSSSELPDVLPQIFDGGRRPASEQRRNISDGNFQLRGKRFLLTYPHCPHLQGSAAAKELCIRLGANRYLVCRELHADKSEHVHVYLEILRGFSSRNAAAFDLVADGTRYHGNYQVVRSPRGAACYVLKDGDFDSFGFTPSEISTLRKLAQRLDLRRVGSRLLEGDRIEAIVREHPELGIRLDIQRVQRQYDAVRAFDDTLKDRVMIEFDLFDFCGFFWKDVPIRSIAPDGSRNLHFWIYGPGGTGKSQSFNNMPYRFYYVDDVDNWASFDNSAFDAILFDDCDPNALAKFGFNKLNRLLDSNPIRMNCKHGHANIVKKMPIIFISNWNILEFNAVGNAAFPAFLSRLHVLSVARTPLGPLYSSVRYLDNPFQNI